MAKKPIKPIPGSVPPNFSTRFQKGKSGNPGGKPQTKAWTEALTVALAEKAETGNGTKLNEVARALVKTAIAGDVAATREIGDRLEGKVAQALIGDPEKPLIIGTTEAERDARLLDLLRKSGIIAAA